MTVLFCAAIQQHIFLLLYIKVKIQGGVIGDFKMLLILVHKTYRSIL